MVNVLCGMVHLAFVTTITISSFCLCNALIALGDIYGDLVESVSECLIKYIFEPIALWYNRVPIEGIQNARGLNHNYR